jgi:4-alpha-glucanotransferase
MGSRERVNVPGEAGAGNWSYRMDKTVDDLAADQANSERLARLASETGREAARVKP